MRQHFGIYKIPHLNKAVRYFLAACSVLFSTAVPAQYSVNDIDSIEMRLNMLSLPDKESYEIYENLIIKYFDENPERALHYSWSGIHFAKKTQNDFYLAMFYYHAGNLHNYANQLDSALHYHDLSLAMKNQAEKRGGMDKTLSDFLEMRLFLLLGDIDVSYGRFDMALNNFLKALAIAEEKMDDPSEEGEICNRIGETYWSIKNMPKAESYYARYEKICRDNNDSVGLASAYRGLSQIYADQDDYPKALEYAEEGHRILSALPDTPLRNLILSTSTLADVWLEIPDYDKALEYTLMQLEYSRQANVPHYITAALTGLSICYLKQKKYKEAEETAFQALETDMNVAFNNTTLYKIITIANIWLKNSEKAYKYFGMSLNAMNEYSNENFQSSISEMEVRYETEKKEAQIASLEEEKRLMTWIGITGGGVLLLGLITLVFLWRWTVQKRRIAEQQIQLVATQAVFDGEVQERSRLARDLHDGLGGKLTGMKINLQELKQKTGSGNDREEQFNAVMEILDDTVREMRRVSHNLMPDTLSRAGLKTAVDDFCRSMSPKIVFNYYGDEARIDMKLEALVYRSIHELVNNALKYADASQIMVQIIRETDRIYFTVQDDGCGFDPTAETNGIGLQGIRSRVASFGGEMQIDSRAGEGTEINVELRVES